MYIHISTVYKIFTLCPNLCETIWISKPFRLKCEFEHYICEKYVKKYLSHDY